MSKPKKHKKHLDVEGTEQPEGDSSSQSSRHHHHDHHHHHKHDDASELLDSSLTSVDSSVSQSIPVPAEFGIPQGGHGHHGHNHSPRTDAAESAALIQGIINIQQNQSPFKSISLFAYLCFFAAGIGIIWGLAIIIGCFSGKKEEQNGLTVYSSSLMLGHQTTVTGLFLYSLSGVLHISFNCILIYGVWKKSIFFCTLWIGGMVSFLLTTLQHIVHRAEVFATFQTGRPADKDIVDDWKIPFIVMLMFTFSFIFIVLVFMHWIKNEGLMSVGFMTGVPQQQGLFA